MFLLRSISMSLVVSLLALPNALANEIAILDDTVRDEVVQALPGWWQLDSFEFIETNSEETVPAPRSTGKVPGAASAAETPASGKPGAVVAPAPAPAVIQTVYFRAALTLTEQVYEPLYALDGIAMVRPIMEAGLNLAVTGSVDAVEEDGVLSFGAVRFDQGGVRELGRPLDEFDLPSLIEGSEEAEAFVASRDEARAEGVLNKIMGDTGEEL